MPLPIRLILAEAELAPHPRRSRSEEVMINLGRTSGPPPARPERQIGIVEDADFSRNMGEFSFGKGSIKTRQRASVVGLTPSSLAFDSATGLRQCLGVTGT